ncbi:MAG: hypothetical protein DMF91_01955 [Acidobacteria bacterium]|nr:MAG: hypothetical protein DMF91_01955 [Acidobacteriota bacterium]
MVMSWFCTACGHKGPPLPPLVRIPAAPVEMTAARRGHTVELRFSVPAANTDGSRPANIERVDVYAFTGPDVRDEELLKRQPTVASVPVKAPRDPNATVEPDESPEDLDPLEGAGLDQGATARVQEELTAASLVPFEVTKKKTRKQTAVDERTPRPFLGPPPVLMRTYVAVPISTHGRPGAISARVQVPLVPPPPPPSLPKVTYDETTITVAWSAPAGIQPETPETDDVLPSTPIGFSPPVIGYHVYDLKPPASEPRDSKPGTLTADTRLTGSPVKETEYADHRIEWGATRCYAVRTVETIGGVSLESDAVPTACTTLVDTFPPAVPKGLTAVPNERAISLIWEPNEEKDLAGYVVLRGTSAEKLEPITTAPIHETSFTDGVPPGAHYFYAVKAVDKAGNVSGPSKMEEATARE